MSGPLTFGSLFAGIGGFEMGLERAGMRPLWQVEKEDYCRAVLARHWPNVRRYEDVRDVGRGNLERIDLISGGFPCQDISYAGYGAGLAGQRSGLWYDFARIIRALRPRYVLVENVAALLDRGMGDVLGTLASLRYDAEWSCVSACSLGAPHMRWRVFIVAHAHGLNGWSRVWDTVAQPNGALSAVRGFASARARWQARLANPSALYGGADGLADGSHRNRAIGNSVAPDVAEWIGRRIVEAHRVAVERAA